MFNNYPDVVTVKEMCIMLKIGRNSGYDLIRCGAVKHIKVGTQYRIPKKWVIDYLKAHQKGA
jgi:excisionase family DNA binding protein